MYRTILKKVLFWRKGLVTIKNIDGEGGKTVTVFVNKKYLNKGDKSKGFCQFDSTGDYITMDYAEKHGYDYLIAVSNCKNASIRLVPSDTNKTHIKIAD